MYDVLVGTYSKAEVHIPHLSSPPPCDRKGKPHPQQACDPGEETQAVCTRMRTCSPGPACALAPSGGAPADAADAMSVPKDISAATVGRCTENTRRDRRMTSSEPRPPDLQASWIFSGTAKPSQTGLAGSRVEDPTGKQAASSCTVVPRQACRQNEHPSPLKNGRCRQVRDQRPSMKWCASTPGGIQAGDIAHTSDLPPSVHAQLTRAHLPPIVGPAHLPTLMKHTHTFSPLLTGCAEAGIWKKSQTATKGRVSSARCLSTPTFAASTAPCLKTPAPTWLSLCSTA